MGKNYMCKVCEKESAQKSHHEAHLKSENHLNKRKILELEMMSSLTEKDIHEIILNYMKKSSSEVDEYKKILNSDKKDDFITSILDEYIENKLVEMETVLIDDIDIDIDIDIDMDMVTNISNREALKEKIHEIHNFLRNNGAGYGMSALKVFNIFYGLKRIEENNLFDKLDLSEECKFSFLLEKSKGGNEELCDIIYNNVLDSLKESNLEYFLFYEIPKNIRGIVFSYLIKELNRLTIIEKSSGEQLTGKIYEYFIGRDRQAISELGAYFTNRLIVEYIYKQLDLECNEDGSIGTMIDPFGGSGGFTTGYINWMKEKYPDLDWKSEINKIHHYDMNDEVIKSAALEFFCITGEVPNMQNLQCKNSFVDEFDNIKFKYCITNPPYGGDKNSKSDAERKRDKLKKKCKEQLKILTDKNIIERRKEQLKLIDKLNKLEKKRQHDQKVTLEKASMRIKKLAKEYELNANDKEAVSLMLMMDMIEEDGIGCGVLKEGVFFDSDYKGLRKCLLENFNVKKVISIPRDQFENTSTKTSIIIFENTEQKTSNVQFYELSCIRYDKDKIIEINGDLVLTENEGDVKKVEEELIANVNIECIMNNDISLEGKKYKAINRILSVKDDYITEELGKYCDFKPSGEKPNIKDFNLVKIGDIDNGIITSKELISTENVKSSHICKENDIIISNVRPKTSKILILTNKYKNINKYCFTPKKIRVKGIDPMYIYAMLYIFIPNFEKELCNGSSYPTFNPAKQLKNYLIPIPKNKDKIKIWTDKLYESYNDYTPESDITFNNLIESLKEEAIEQ